ncbi:MAG: methyltransferase domain-containing protein [bacterium]
MTISGSTEPFIRPEKFWCALGLRANQTVAHLGCGAGFYIIPAAKIVGHKGQVIGVDVLPDMLQEVEGRARREGVDDIVRTVRANLENKRGSTLKKDIADWTLVANILYQSDPVKILREAARVTKPGGTIIIVEWDIISTPLGPPVETRVSQSQVLALAEKIKLKFSDEFNPSPYHYGLLLAV